MQILRGTRHRHTILFCDIMSWSGSVALPSRHCAMGRRPLDRLRRRARKKRLGIPHIPERYQARLLTQTYLISTIPGSKTGPVLSFLATLNRDATADVKPLGGMDHRLFLWRPLTHSCFFWQGVAAWFLQLRHSESMKSQRHLPVVRTPDLSVIPIR